MFDRLLHFCRDSIFFSGALNTTHDGDIIILIRRVEMKAHDNSILCNRCLCVGLFVFIPPLLVKMPSVSSTRDASGSDVDEIPSRAAAMAMKYCRWLVLT